MWIFHFISLFYIIIVENRCTYYEIFCDNIYQIAFILRKGNREWVNFAEIGINLQKKLYSTIVSNYEFRFMNLLFLFYFILGKSVWEALYKIIKNNLNLIEMFLTLNWFKESVTTLTFFERSISI